MYKVVRYSRYTCPVTVGVYKWFIGAWLRCFVENQTCAYNEYYSVEHY